MKNNSERMVPFGESISALIDTFNDYNNFLNQCDNIKNYKLKKQRQQIGLQNAIKNFEYKLNQLPSVNDEKNEIDELNKKISGVGMAINDNIETKSNNNVYNDNFEEFQEEDEKDNHKDNCKKSDKPWMKISKKFKEEHKIDNNEVKKAIKISEINNKKEEDKKEDKDSKKNIDELNIDEWMNYINGEGGIKTKKKKKKKKNKKQQTEKVKTAVQEKEKEFDFEEFKTYIKEHSINNNEITKIKPCLSKGFINGLE